MNIAGIIAEYNPFHNGHRHQVRLLRENGFDYIVALMSGDFVQRGAPAIIGKHDRARMALLGGVDLVLELPSLFAVSPAEAFAECGVRLLDALGINALSFGAEAPDLPLLRQLLELQEQEPPEYREALKNALRSGQSYPAAQNAAASVLLPEADAILKHPNNILALEYVRAAQKIHSSMELLPIQRMDAGYHSIAPKEQYLSAEGIRALLRKREDIGAYLPEESREILLGSRHAPYLSQNDFSLLLRYRLLSQSDFRDLPDCGEALSKKLLREREAALSFEELISRLKTKDLTYARISRVLVNLLLERTGDTLAFYRNAPVETSGYARLLGFREKSEPLLRELKIRSRIPLISKKKETSALDTDAARLLDMDIFASRVYNLVCSEKTGKIVPGDYEHPLEIV